MSDINNTVKDMDAIAAALKKECLKKLEKNF
jgi:hypothetical protein